MMVWMIEVSVERLLGEQGRWIDERMMMRMRMMLLRLLLLLLLLLDEKSGRGQIVVPRVFGRLLAGRVG